MRRLANYLVIVGVLFVLTGCQAAYYNTMESFGYHKRDLLVGNVEDARDAQEDAKEQFKSALEHFSSVTGFHGGELQNTYEKLNDAYEDSEQQADTVRKRIISVEDVAEALFEEWEDELEQYSSTKLRRSSERQLQATKRQYAKLIAAMKRAEKKIQPVLDAFHDQVLFLKHNLNAQAIASLTDELDSIETDVRTLVKEMEASINEANSFIDSMKGAS